MEIELELHIPGLDMSSHRWTHHLIFMEEVHKRQHEVVALGRQYHEAQGRGTLYVDQQHWREVIRDAVSETKRPFPCTYVGLDEAPGRFASKLMHTSFRQVIAEYDPAVHTVLTVQHYPDGPTSCYLIRSAAD